MDVHGPKDDRLTIEHAMPLSVAFKNQQASLAIHQPSCPRSGAVSNRTSDTNVTDAHSRLPFSILFNSSPDESQGLGRLGQDY
jgi:hypothetical protein